MDVDVSLRPSPLTNVFPQVDVTGRCLTMYKVTEKGYESLTVTKVKDVLSCQDRQSARTSMLSTPFTSPNVSIRDLSSKIYKDI